MSVQGATDLRSLSLGAAINVILNFVLIKKMGIEGVAIATLIGYLVTIITVMIVSYRIKCMIYTKRMLLVWMTIVAYFYTQRVLLFDRTMIQISLMAIVIMFLFFYTEVKFIKCLEREEDRMVRLRSLLMDDAKYMMEYINDNEISSNFKFTRYPFSDDGFKCFIQNSWNDRTNLHYAIEDGEYAGTISLKNINAIDRTAEYAIVTRKKFWGTGISKEATNQIINYGFNTLNLEKIYLNVLSMNIRANRFYEKMGFKFEGTFKKHVFINGKYEDLNWYCVFKR